MLEGNQSLQSSADKGTLGLFKEFSKPELMIANTAQSRTKIDESSEAFEILADVATELIVAAYSPEAENFLETKPAEWQTALKANSIYLRYPSTHYFDVEAALYQGRLDKGFSAQNNYDEVVMVPTGEDSFALFFRDRLRNQVAKKSQKSANAASVLKLLREYGMTKEKDFIFAYELNLDEENDGKAVLDSMLLINTKGVKAKSIVADIPKTYRAGLNFTRPTEFMTSLLKIFGYNPNTVRQYANSDNALIFVAETGSLSVYPDGRIEYKALGTNEGVALATSGQAQLQSVNSELCNIIEKIISLSGVGLENADFELKFTQMPQNVKFDQRTEINLDYFVDGKMVVFGADPAVYAVVENGRLVEIKMQVRDIKKLDNETTFENVFEEIDSFCETNSGCKTITAERIVYEYKKNGEEIRPQWQISGMR